MNCCEVGEESQSNVDQKDRKEVKRNFSIYPKLVLSSDTISLRNNNIWLELSHFIIDDLKWLLSLDYESFLSCLVHSASAQELIQSILKESPPCYVRFLYKIDKEIDTILSEIEHLLFLTFARIVSDFKSNEPSNVKNLRNEFLKTEIGLREILNLCLFFNSHNAEILKKLIVETIRCDPSSFRSDLSKLVSNFFNVLSATREKFHEGTVLKLVGEFTLDNSEIVSSTLYLHDAVTSVQMFLDVYSDVCPLFGKSEYICEMVSFYSRVLPKIYETFENSERYASSSQLKISHFVDGIRIDMLKIVRSVFNHLACRSKGSDGRKHEIIDEYLTLMIELLSEPDFFRDYRRIYPAENEIRSLVNSCRGNLDAFKVEHILQGLDSATGEACGRRPSSEPGPEPSEYHLTNLVAEVRDVFPQMTEQEIRKCLKLNGFVVEKTIAAVLDCSPDAADQLPDSHNETKGDKTFEKGESYSGSVKDRKQEDRDHWERDEFVDKTKYARWFFVSDETYDDEYDDTYDGHAEVAVFEDENEERRPFVVPRVLRQSSDSQYEEIGMHTDEENEVEEEENTKDISYGEKKNSKGREWGKGTLGSDGKGKPQGKGVQQNRNYKEVHKSRMANHNRKKQAGRKRNMGMIPS